MSAIEHPISFMTHRKPAMLLSLLLVLAAASSIIWQGFNFSLDFTGGTLLEVRYPDAVEPETLRQYLQGEGYGDAVVQNYGSSQDIIVRLPPQENVSKQQASDAVFALLQQQTADVELLQVDFVGPQLGSELVEKGGLALLVALLGILFYVGVRFEYRFALGAVAALIHDVLITLGFFSLFQLSFDPAVLAAVLAVIGYSLNDTIVVCDRIRENFRIIRDEEPEAVTNISLTQTLSRTLITSLTTLLVLAALYVFGGEVIQGFAIALIVGVLIGTYSSVYVASSCALALGISKEDLIPPPKEGADLDELP